MTGMDIFDAAVATAMFMILSLSLVLVLDYDQTVKEIRKGASWLIDQMLHLFGYQLVPEYQYYKR